MTNLNTMAENSLELLKIWNLYSENIWISFQHEPTQYINHLIWYKSRKKIPFTQFFDAYAVQSLG